MSTNIDCDQTFLGLPLLKGRNVLKAWRYGWTTDAHDIALRKDVDLNPCTAMVLLEELRDRGLIGPEDQEYLGPIDGVTGVGHALAFAGGKKRTPKDRARLVLREFLDAWTAVNACSDVPFDVREVWMSGSMIDEAKMDVGDFDLVFVSGQPERFRTASLGHRARSRLKSRMWPDCHPPAC